MPVSSCTAGTVILTLKANSVTAPPVTSGPTSTVTGATVTIDRTAPTITALDVAIRTKVTLAGTAVPLKLTWTGADEGGAGIARYEFARSTDKGTTWGTPVRTTATSAATTVPSTGTVRYRVCAVDRVGNIGAWMTGPVLTPRLVQAATSYTRTWSTSTSTRYSGGSTRYATVAGASASYTFTGRSIALVTTKALSRGSVKVYVDGSLAGTVSTYAHVTTYRAVVWATAWPTSGTHTVKLVVVGTAGHPRVDLDAFAVVK